MDMKMLLHALGAGGKRKQFEAEDGGLQSKCLQPEPRLKLISVVFKRDLEPSWHANKKIRRHQTNRNLANGPNGMYAVFLRLKLVMLELVFSF